MKAGQTGFLALMILALAASSAHAECVKTPPKQWLKIPEAELAFSGKVVEVTKAGEQGVRATFQVERVWKGPVSERINLYMSPPESPEHPVYEKDHSYMVIAQRLVDRKRRANAGLADSDAVVFTGMQCSPFISVDEFVGAVGRGKPPKQNQEWQIPDPTHRASFTRPLIPATGGASSRGVVGGPSVATAAK
jgi:hypothetical protein